MLTDNRDLLDRIAETLLERETLEGPQLQRIMKGEPLPALGGDSGDPVAPERSSGRRDEDVPDGSSGGNMPDPEPMPG